MADSDFKKKIHLDGKAEFLQQSTVQVICLII